MTTQATTATRTITVTKRDGTEKSVETTYTDDAVFERLVKLTGHIVLDRTIGALQQRDPDAPLARSGFACDLAVKGYRRGLSAKQIAWVHILVMERETPREDAPAAGSLPRIRKMIDAAAAEIQHPKVNLVTGSGQKIRLSRAGERSRTPGTINITDGKPYGENTYFGKIDLDGNLIPARAMTDEVLDFLQSFDADPAAVATAYGHRTGSCCFCSRDLTDGRSVVKGYGPICAERFHLPWGDETISSTVEVG
jgi:hypothetical protein